MLRPSISDASTGPDWPGEASGPLGSFEDVGPSLARMCGRPGTRVPAARLHDAGAAVTSHDTNYENR